MLKLCFLVLVTTVGYVLSAVALYPYQPKPAELEDQEGCFISDLYLVLPYENPYYPKGKKTCLQYTCGKDNLTQLLSCGAVAYPGNCHLEYDYSLDYPKCCGTLVCVPTTTTEEPIPTTNEPATSTEESTTASPITATPTTEATCVTVTEEPPCDCQTQRQKPKPPKSSRIPKNPKSPEKPKTPEKTDTPEILETPEYPEIPERPKALKRSKSPKIINTKQLSESNKTLNNEIRPAEDKTFNSPVENPES